LQLLQVFLRALAIELYGIGASLYGALTGRRDWVDSGRRAVYGLAVLITQIIRHRVEVLYPTTLVVRLFFLVVLAWLLLSSSDPFFAVVFGIVALGVILTGSTYLSERGAAHA